MSVDVPSSDEHEGLCSERMTSMNQQPTLHQLRRVWHFLSSGFLKDSQRKQRLAHEKSRAALRNRETTISCHAIASSTHLFTITNLMGVALSSDLF